MVFSSTTRDLVVSADGTTAPPDAGVDTYAAASAHVDSDSAGTAAYGAAEPQACVDTCAALVDAAGVDTETDDVATNQLDAYVSAAAVARAAGTDAADVCAGFDADAAAEEERRKKLKEWRRVCVCLCGRKARRSGESLAAHGGFLTPSHYRS